MPHRRIIAVIDVGSNSVRLLAAREISPSAFEVIDEERFDARLGEGQVYGQISSAGIERGLEALRVVSQVAASHAPTVTIAVGTEALRRAENAHDFLDQVLRETGIAIRILSGAEEAHASFLGTVNSTLLRDGYVIDIGGGSLELLHVEGRALVRAQSVPLGAIYASEHYLAHDPPTGKEVRSLRKAVRQSLDVGVAPPVLYGVGGALRNLARIVRLRRRYPLRRLHGLTLERGEMRRLARDLAAVPAETRRKIPGVNSHRADILHAAAIVLDEVMELTGAPEMHVSGQGLREGLVWQQLRGEGPVLRDVRAASIAGLARANGVNEHAAEPVVTVAAQLFEATRPVHGLGREDLDLLLNAARLAGIGMHVDYYNRDRHAEYLVHSGDLHGFTHREIVMLGSLVRCAVSGSPDLSLYKRIAEPADTARVASLAVLLGIARAIRRRMPSPVHEVRSGLDNNRLLVELVGTAPLDAELLAVSRQARRLENVLGLELVVSASG
jgi:exopolyphosphatase/guanosine-5'-triphosphate,3'-diphosphate pyrophosphatase